mmetsp:Transcript_5594/g.12913  ORF Transcript_5594/g.12913 Transcript_5594/m.12913 type:complete len:219 (-) Transcript_5594:287-943(-)
MIHVHEVLCPPLVLDHDVYFASDQRVRSILLRLKLRHSGTRHLLLHRGGRLAHPRPDPKARHLVESLDLDRRRLQREALPGVEQRSCDGRNKQGHKEHAHNHPPNRQQLASVRHGRLVPVPDRGGRHHRQPERVPQPVGVALGDFGIDLSLQPPDAVGEDDGQNHQKLERKDGKLVSLSQDDVEQHSERDGPRLLLDQSREARVQVWGKEGKPLEPLP